MKFFSPAVLLAVFTLALYTCPNCSEAAPSKTIGRIDYSAAHETTHRINMDKATCSATAISEHVLLTAMHCIDEPFEVFRIDHEIVAIKDIAVDGNDHAMILVDHTFESWAPVGEQAAMGEDIFFWGNPGGMEDIMRKGYVANPAATGLEFLMPVAVYAMPVYFGDSGAGIFNLNGEVTAVVSKLYSNESFILMGSFQFAFTRSDLALMGLSVKDHDQLLAPDYR